MLVGDLAGPLIGAIVFKCSSGRYSSFSRIALWSIPSTYIAVMLFGAALGMTEMYTRGILAAINDIFIAVFCLTAMPRCWSIFLATLITQLWVGGWRLQMRRPALEVCPDAI